MMNIPDSNLHGPLQKGFLHHDRIFYIAQGFPTLANASPSSEAGMSIDASMSDKPTLVLLHQTPSTCMMFMPLMEQLSTQAQVIALDTPGYGQSRGETNDIKQAAQSLYHALQDFGVQRACVLGHHTGASLAVELAVSYPGFVTSLILGGPPFISNEQRVFRLAQVLEIKKQVRKEQVLLAPLIPSIINDHDRMLTPTAKQCYQHIYQSLQKKDSRASAHIIQRELLYRLLAADQLPMTYQAVWQHPFATYLLQLSIPIFLYAGVEDSLIEYLPNAVEQVQKVNPCTMQRVFQEAGGYICELASDRLSHAIVDFWTLYDLL